MLGVRLKTWVKTHLGRERHNGHTNNANTTNMSGPLQLSSSMFSYHHHPRDNHQDISFINPDKSTSSYSSSASTGGLAINATLLSSPDTGYSTDGLSNSNILKTASNSTSSITTPSSNPPTSTIQLNQQYTSAKKRDWFLQNPAANSSVIPFKLHQLPQQNNHSSSVVPIKPSRIKTNPWYNPKSKRPISSPLPGPGIRKSKDGKMHSNFKNDNLLTSAEHARLSTCTTITADSGEGSLDSQKSSPRVSFSNSSLESYKPEHTTTTSSAVEDWRNVNRFPLESACETKKLPEHQARYDVRQSPQKINGGWYQCQPPVQYNTTPKPPAPPLIHTGGQNGGIQAMSTHFAGTSAPNERSSKRKPFGFFKKLFRKSQSKKSRSNGSSNEVSIHDLYYHKNPTISSITFQNQRPPTVPPRISSFLTPTPNAFRRKMIIDTSSISARKNLTPNIGYSYREPLQQQQPQNRTPVLSRQHVKTEINDNDGKYKINGGAYASIGPKLNSAYCSPSRQQSYDYGRDYYSSPPVNNCTSSPRSSYPRPDPAAVNTNSPMVSHHHQPYNLNPAANETPSKRSHILNRKLILQSPTPFTNNSSYSPIHRVAVLKGSGNPGNSNGVTRANSVNPAMFSNNHFNNGNILKTQRPEFFSPQQHHHTAYHHSPATSFRNNPYDKNPSTFFSPQLKPTTVRNDPSRRCFQYISSSNQNSPILNAHRQSSSGTTPLKQQQQQMLFNRISPIIPATFNHRVHPIKNYIQASNTVGPSIPTKLTDSSHLLSSATSGIGILPNLSRIHPITTAAPTTSNIDKIYEEINDEEEEEEAVVGEDDEEADEITRSSTATAKIEDENNKLLSSQHYSDEGDEQGGDYYQFDYDSSLLSTTEETDENSQAPSTASTSTLLKSGEHDRRSSSTQLSTMPMPIPSCAMLEQHEHGPVGRAASVDISSTTRQLLEIENDLRFCRLIAEAQTLLKELESTTVSLSTTRNGLEQYSKQNINCIRQPLTFDASNTYRRNHRSTSRASGFEECPQSDPLRRKAYECWALRRLQQELAGCCASPLAFRHNLVPRQQLHKRRGSSGGVNL